ncbi:hypothetical protein OQA88_9444 [Cercophora sp. LCS_1]
MAELNFLTATIGDLEKSLADGSTTSEQIVTRYLNRIDAYNGYLHAIISTPSPREKDNIATDPALGMETTAGTYALVGSRVKRSAVLAKQLQDAGAIILAKANLGELSNFRGLRMPAGWSAVGGLTQSPYVVGGKKWDDGFGGHSASGGSSSGSCVAVAAGLAPAAVGTDTNGSILMPATRHDVYAMKPTLGLISRDGICPICLEFDSAGPIARHPRDIALLMDAMVDPENPHAKPGGSYTAKLTRSFDGLRIGVLDPREWHLPSVVAVPNEAVNNEFDREISNAYDKLRFLGVTVKEVRIASPDELEVDGMSQIGRAMVSGFRHDFEDYLKNLDVSKVRSLEDVMAFMKENTGLEFPPESPNMQRLETAAKFSLPTDVRAAAIEDMRDWGRRRAVDKCLKEYDVDIILGPADSEMDDLYSAAGYPMANLPLSYSSFNGRPFGLCATASQY